MSLRNAGFTSLVALVTALSAIACGSSTGSDTGSGQSALGEDAEQCGAITGTVTGGETSITGEFDEAAADRDRWSGGTAVPSSDGPVSVKIVDGLRPMGLLWTNVDCRCDFSGGEGSVSKTARSSYGICGSQDSAAQAKSVCFRTAYNAVLNDLSSSRRAYELRFHSLHTSPYSHLVASGSLGNISCQ